MLYFANLVSSNNAARKSGDKPSAVDLPSLLASPNQPPPATFFASHGSIGSICHDSLTDPESQTAPNHPFIQ